jgi:hypothetical protein
VENKEKDEWQLALEKKLQELKECQQNMKLDSCFKCDKTFECEVRSSYVKAVYESMNKGSGGGFEF